MQASIFLNGRHPKLSIIRKFAGKNRQIIAADGGANFLQKSGIKPDIIIGDLDSILKENLDFFNESGVKVRKISEQETTDFEKCLVYCAKKKFDEVVVFGATSMRPDHTMNNFSVMKRYSGEFPIKMISDEFEIFYADKEESFDYKPGETLSMLAMPVAYNIFTEGLEFTLTGEDLEFGKREGTLNKAVSDTVTIRHDSGSLLIFRKHFLN